MSSSWSSKPRLDVRRNDIGDEKGEDSISSASSSDPLASAGSSRSLSPPKSDRASQRRKKKKEAKKLIRMMENSVQDAERRERFDGSFQEEEGMSIGWQQSFGEFEAESNEVRMIATS